MIERRKMFSWMAVAFGCGLFFTATAGWANLRIATYNILADNDPTNSQSGIPQPEMGTVLQAIGNEHLNGNAQPIDVLALQELWFSPSLTLQPIVDSLNSIYGAGTYAYDPFVGATTGALVGNGPNGLIYNTKTVKVVQHVGIGDASGSGAPRQPIRYRLEPVGYGSDSDFYLYVSHYKSGTDSTSIDRRNIEATEIRADADNLGANAHVIYSGDLNLTGSSEAAYQTLISSGNGQANDVKAPSGTWSASTVANDTESATSIKFRDDFQLVNGATLNQPGLQLQAASYSVFGNNGSVPLGGRVDAAGNTALGDLSNRTTVLSDLTVVTDHLPVVADYSLVGVSPIPEPASLGLLLGCGLLLRRPARPN